MRLRLFFPFHYFWVHTVNAEASTLKLYSIKFKIIWVVYYRSNRRTMSTNLSRYWNVSNGPLWLNKDQNVTFYPRNKYSNPKVKKKFKNILCIKQMMVVCDCLLPLFVLSCYADSRWHWWILYLHKFQVSYMHCPWLLERPIWTFQTVDTQEVNYE